jgi:CRISPR system Cascade subunit CasD
MTCLVVRLAGPMQSWGTQSRFSERDTGREPSKSGIVGLLCAAKGIDRNDNNTMQNISQTLSMGVRVDREGILSRDYHTAGGGTINGEPYGVIKASGAKGDPVISNRYYLADAEFMVALQSDDQGLLTELKEALDHPKWPLYLGRKSFVPTPPVCLGIKDESIEEVLKVLPWQQRNKLDKKPDQLRTVVDCNYGEGATRMDEPLSFKKDDRKFLPRYVKTYFIEDFPVNEYKEDELCIYHV